MAVSSRWLLCVVMLAAIVQQAAAVKRSNRVYAQRRYEIETARRRLLQANEAAAPAPVVPAGPPLELPENPLETCSYKVVREATKCEKRKEIFFEGTETIDEECCKRISSYYSNASKKPTRNCWCDPDVWARELELEVKSYITLATYFDTCAASNYTVGDELIAYYQDGAGPCAGLPAAAPVEAAPTAPPPELPPKRSFGKWVREGLPDNPYVLFCFIVSIPSVVGFNIILWPFLFHAVLTVVEFPAKWAAKKAV